MKTILLFTASLSVVSQAFAGNWPAWRGPQGTGVTSEKNLPMHWSASENIRWKVPLPDRGNSTPIIWGDQVFVTQAIEKENRRTLMCFDRATGKLLWQSGTTYAEKEPTHDDNPYCAASPTTDGERIVASFGSAGLFCYDMKGKEIWHRDLGKVHHIWGNAASPVLYRDLCILNVGPGDRQFLIAVDKKTGKDVWQIDEPGGHSGETKPGEDPKKPTWVGSWSTPLIINTAGRDELIMTFPKRVAALDPKTGKEIWACDGLNPLVYTSPLYSDGIVVAMGGFGGSSLAVKTGGTGNVTDTHRLWYRPKNRQRIGSGVIHDGHIYEFTDPGVAECIDLKTGNFVWEERLKGPNPNGVSWSSALLSGDKIYFMNTSADVFVAEANTKFSVLATNSLEKAEKTRSSIVPSNGQLFIRTYQNLWCIGSDIKTAQR